MCTYAQVTACANNDALQKLHWFSVGSSNAAPSTDANLDLQLTMYTQSELKISIDLDHRSFVTSPYVNISYEPCQFNSLNLMYWDDRQGEP